MTWKRPFIPLAIIALLVIVSWLRMQPGEEQALRRSQLLMGTVVEIVAYGEDKQLLEAAVSEAFREISRLDKLMSRHYPDSDVSLLSQSQAGRQVAPEVAEVIALGLDVARNSNGAFDMTLGQVKRLWGFDQQDPLVPAKDALARAIAGIGPEALTLQGTNVSKASPQLMIDLGGIAKGYAVDRAIAVLRQQGVVSGAVNAGGDMFLLGRHPEREWRIGIQHPRQQGGTLATVKVNDQAVVTSGDYERYFEQGGQRYHHIFDPSTGMPADRCQSVTVIANSVALGDALATALFVLGPQDGLALLAAYPGTEALVIAADGSQHPSPGWAGYLVDR